ncbi:glucosyl-3-phosphoglycerate synthase [Petrotoga miotherma DSM 10691]|uniref:Glucosyl-3-phosphoglycerate synthase n=2 Tax=Petrotoga TaxID=28236 RepID=A0A2K1PC48_9BACT|nr:MULTISPECIES: glucosyl-3-phosphoglycerate synthase [Petrotoga]MDN5345811.1 glucosyl-3-phosphoglycerate synthase [Petrotoga sp.]PNS00384.1 glucosyl-3-phosphoglycerate synthase [Petrotoga miotherma DSM 10691]POZ92343.1 glucosyl-3-phosphoglycerate synthase [Petrotoga halophila DSM 16923]
MKDNILKRSFHHSKFENIKELVKIKEKQDVKISLAFPSLNEEKTIGKEIIIMKTELMEKYPLLDEIAVIDSGSEDETVSIAKEYGAKVFYSSDILPEYGFYKGKGENLWKSLYALNGDIIVWVDSDIENIHPKFVYGLVGALLNYPEIGYVKAFYDRPIVGKSAMQPTGGGRVTELVARPLFSLFYPELSTIIQPLSGEYAGRREILEKLPFFVGYGVEIAHLIDISEKFGTEIIAQVDLELRIHDNQPLHSLSKMAFELTKVVLKRLEKYGKLDLNTELNDKHLMIQKKENEKILVPTEILSVERPPIITIPEYKEKFSKGEKV